MVSENLGDVHDEINALCDLAGRCPSCKWLAVKKGKRWCCRRIRKMYGRKAVRQADGTFVMERVKLDLLRYLICGAKGVVMSDGTLAVTSGGVPQPKEEE